ncbi:MAG: ATP synthase F1 subunit gamma [Bacteroidia bacterium]|nr:ATP synthase F1 subunit gamma [Bacteroidia bacterium]MDW8236600.1 ATP synthase F1 subunit gamma [Bacteroidia bacterium]
MSSGKLRELRGRIRSVIAIQQTTRAMRMIAAVKLRRAQERLTHLRPFHQNAKHFLELLLSHLEEPHPYQNAPAASRSLWVILSSSRGLCGAFNSGLLRWLMPQLPPSKEVELLVLGKKAYEGLRRSGYSMQYHDLFGAKDISPEAAYAQADAIWDAFKQGKYREVVLVYNRFASIGKAVPTREVLLPLPAASERKRELWFYEPSLEQLVEGFVPLYVRTMVWTAVQESVTAEHSARMVAMQMASDNAEELIRTLRLQYNKARQASITKELLEIVAGAEALKG